MGTHRRKGVGVRSKAMAEGKQRAVRCTEGGLWGGSGAGTSCVSLETQLRESEWGDPEDGVRENRVRTWAVFMGTDIGTRLLLKCSNARVFFW